MTRQGGGFGRVVLWVVLGVVGIILIGNVIGWLLGALWNILLATLLIAAIAGVALLVIRAAGRSLPGRGDRRKLPR